MEQERYWMWTKQKEGINSHVLLSSNRSTNYVDSWEEQAFADDAAGPLGGCIWPPRSYTCSFCRRELRSAQALGGHMNVHRRDRARLKQSPSTSPNNIEMLHDSQILNPSHQICSMVSNPTSDNRDHAFLAPPPSSISSRVSILPMQPSTVDKKTLILLPFTSFLQDNLKSSVAPFSSWSKLDSKNYFHLQGLEKEEKGANLFESNSTAKSNQLTSDLSVNLSLVTKRSYDTVSDDKDEDLVVSCKRRLLDETLSFLPKRVSIDRHQPESEVLDELNSPSSIDILDLELRLGDRPK